MPRPASSPTKALEKSVAHCYSTWGTSYFDDYYRSPAAYPPVHVDIVRKALRKHGAKSVLDAGCGPASMLRLLRAQGKTRYGFDLTPEMTAEAQRVLGAQGVPEANIWLGSVLDPAAYRLPSRRPRPDAAICFGVLPHVRDRDDKRVFRNLRGAVRPGGLVLIEARNELFSLFTANRYSHAFITERLSAVDDLLAAAGGERESLTRALEQFTSLFRMDLPPVRRGKESEPGYDEVLSRTHNPFTAREQFERAGFCDVKVLFYHYHCLPPLLESAAPALFRARSVAMEKPDDWRGHFMASAFILSGVAS